MAITAAELMVVVGADGTQATANQVKQVGTSVAGAAKTGSVEISQLDRTIAGLNQGAAGMIQAMTGLSLGTLGAVGGIGLLAAGIRSSVRAAMEAEVVQAQLEAVLRSTGGAAGLTAADLDALATSLSRMSGMDDEVIKRNEALMMTFREVSGDVFPEAMEAALNMSMAMGQDLQSSVIQLGKALNDPIDGLSSLRRVGVQFTDEQERMIKGMVEAGDVMGAQGVILDELEAQFGGVAAAMGDTMTGQIGKLRTEMGNLGETVGSVLVPALTEAAKALNLILTAPGNLEGVWRQHEQDIRATASSYEEYITEAMRSAEAAQLLNVNFERLQKSGMVMSDWAVDEVVRLGALDEATWASIRSTMAYGHEMEGLRSQAMLLSTSEMPGLQVGMDNAAKAAEEEAKRLEEAARAAEALRQASVGAGIETYNLAESLKGIGSEALGDTFIDLVSQQLMNFGVNGQQASAILNQLGLDLGEVDQKSLLLSQGLPLLAQAVAQNLLPAGMSGADALRMLSDGINKGQTDLFALFLQMGLTPMAASQLVAGLLPAEQGVHQFGESAKGSADGVGEAYTGMGDTALTSAATQEGAVTTMETNLGGFETKATNAGLTFSNKFKLPVEKDLNALATTVFPGAQTKISASMSAMETSFQNAYLKLSALYDKAVAFKSWADNNVIRVRVVTEETTSRGGGGGGGGDNCFVGETMVDTPGGQRRIDSIQAGDLVFVYGGDATPNIGKVKKLFRDRRDDLVEIQTEQGAYVCSPNHRWLIVYRGWRAARQIVPGMRVVSMYRSVRVVTGVRRMEGTYDVFNFEVDDPSHTYFVDGHVVHNKKEGAAEGGVIGSPTLVGERGPEIFIPSTAGRVLSNRDSRQALADIFGGMMGGGGGGLHIGQLNVQTLGDAESVAEAVGRELEMTARLYG